MAVSEYKKIKRYQVGTLKPYVLLLPKNSTLINYSIDNGYCNVASIKATEVLKIEGLSATYSSEETLNGRFKFSNTLTINIPEGLHNARFTELSQLLVGDYYTIFETEMGARFMQTVDLPVEMTYSYQFVNTSVSANICALSFGSYSNIPTVMLDATVSVTPTQTFISNECGYNLGRVKKLEMINFKNCLVVQDSNGLFTEIYTNGGQSFSGIDFDVLSFNYTEAYDQNVFTQTLTFTIPLDEYKNYWHYNLIEFSNNRYMVRFTTANGNVIMGGFDFGFTPTYTIASAESNTGMDTITITLRHSGDCISGANREGNFIEKEDDRTSLAPVDEIKDQNGNATSTVVCLDQTTGIYTLFEELTMSGQRTGRYWCLSGYEDRYQHLNIVGTYTQESDLGYPITFQSQECSVIEECQFLITPPSAMSFTQERETRTYTLSGECDWTIINIPSWLTISPTTGNANQAYQITFTTVGAVPEEMQTATVQIQSGQRNYNITVNYGKQSPWIAPIVFNINAAAQDCVSTLTNYSVYAPYSISDVHELLNGVSFVSATVVASVPKNNTDQARTMTYSVTNANGDTVVITINQDRIYTANVLVDGVVCDGTNSYQKLEIYEGYTPDNINMPTGQYVMGDPVMTNDPQCASTTTQWRETGNMLCDGSTQYAEEMQYTSNDGGKTWVSTGITRLGRLVEINSPECDPRYQWVVSSETVCISNNLFQVLQKTFRQDDGTTIFTGETKVGELIEAMSDQCASRYDQQFYFCTTTPGFSSGDCLNNLATIYCPESFTFSFDDGYWETHNNTKADYSVNISHCFADYEEVHTCTVTGNVGRIDIMGNDATSCFRVVNWGDTDGGNLQELNINPNFENDCTIEELDLSKFDMMVKLVIHNHTGENGLPNFTPPGNTFSYLDISNEDGKVTHITPSQLTTIVDSLPSLTMVAYRGYINFCNLIDSDGTNIACSAIDNAKAAELLAKGWMYNQECCEVEGAKKYQLVKDGEKYLCEGFTKFEYMTIMVSTFTNGAWSEWVDTGEITKGEAIEYLSTDCGYILPVMEEWRRDDNYYVCEGTDSYYAEVKYISTDGGKTYTMAIPLETRSSGQLKKENDENCGGTPPEDYQYRWVVVDDEFICITDPDNPDEDLCSWVNLWVDFGFDPQTKRFDSNSTVQALPTICDGTDFTTMDSMFENLQLLGALPNFDSSNVTSAVRAFRNCLNLQIGSFGFDDYNLAKLTNATSMFENCPDITSITFPTQCGITTADNMFKGDYSLSFVDFNGLSTITSMTGIFDDCTKLASITGLELSAMSGNVELVSTGEIPNLTVIEIGGLHDCILMLYPFINIKDSSLEYIIEHTQGGRNSNLEIYLSEAQYVRLVDLDMQNLAREHGVTLTNINA